MSAQSVRVARFLLRSTVQNRIAILAVLVLLVVVALSTGTRMLVVREGTDGFQPINVSIEHMTPERMTQLGHLFLALPASSDFADAASILFSEEGAFTHLPPLEVLEGVLVLVFPIVALLIGASLSPRREGAMHTLLSAPIRPSAIYLGHLFAALLSCALLGIVTWVGVAILLLLAAPDGSLGELLRLLSVMTGYITLYGAIFCGLGLSLGTLLRKYATALMAGLLCIILMVGLMPSLKEASGRAYVANHREAYMSFANGGAEPTDAAWVLDRFVLHMPTNAVRTILWLTRMYSPVRRAGCLTCGGTSAPGRGYDIAAETIALAIAAALSFLIGIPPFLWREGGAP